MQTQSTLPDSNKPYHDEFISSPKQPNHFLDDELLLDLAPLESRHEGHELFVYMRLPVELFLDL